MCAMADCMDTSYSPWPLISTNTPFSTVLIQVVSYLIHLVRSITSGFSMSFLFSPFSDMKARQVIPYLESRVFSHLVSGSCVSPSLCSLRQGIRTSDGQHLNQLCLPIPLTDTQPVVKLPNFSNTVANCHVVVNRPWWLKLCVSGMLFPGIFSQSNGLAKYWDLLNLLLIGKCFSGDRLRYQSSLSSPLPLCIQN